MRRERYIGQARWEYRLPDGAKGVVTLPVPEGNYVEDESAARGYVRRLLKLKRLPAGTRVYPERSIS